jgi:hypothetical protein
LFLLRVACILGLSILLSPWLQTSLLAQVFEVGGGTSTLYQASGGGVTVHAPSYDLTVGAGVIDGHLLGGAQMVKATPHATYILGDDRISFRLPTDIFDVSHFFLARGIGMRATRRGNDILALVGATATDYNSPLFDGAKTNQAAGVLFLKRNLKPNLGLISDTIVSNKITAIEAIQWTPRPKLDLALAGGIGANQPYGAVSLNYSRPWIDARAAYIEAGTQFHRVALVSPLLAEPDRENVLVTVRPWTFLSYRCSSELPCASISEHQQCAQFCRSGIGRSAHLRYFAQRQSLSVHIREFIESRRLAFGRPRFYRTASCDGQLSCQPPQRFRADK